MLPWIVMGSSCRVVGHEFTFQGEKIAASILDLPSRTSEVNRPGQTASRD
jgi:hypothetical protein